LHCRAARSAGLLAQLLVVTTGLLPRDAATNSYLFGRGPAWFAYLMTIALMIFYYIDRQIIVSMFPFLKSDWMLTDPVPTVGSLIVDLSICSAPVRTA